MTRPDLRAAALQVIDRPAVETGHALAATVRQAARQESK
jgi:hypothetical protein